MAFVAFNTTSAQTAVAVESGFASTISLDKEVHDYGTINQGDNGKCTFTITNNGSEPFMLDRCKGSCGCTVPKCPKEPIAPGASATIDVNYDTKRVGPINKSVTMTVTQNGETVNKVVRIKGKILAPAAGPTLSPTPAGPVEGK